MAIKIMLTQNKGALKELCASPVPRLPGAPGLFFETSLVAQRVKRLPAMWETQVPSLGWEDPLGKEMATPSGTLA